MKSTQEMAGLRIISISDGTQVGYIKDVVINPKEGTLDFFVIDQPSDYLGAKVIAFTDAIGLGEFALTIPDANVIQDVAQNLTVQELLRQNTRVIGTKVLTKSGKLSGEVQEIFIDEKSGKISSCQVLLSNGELYDINASQVITYGKELLIVEDEKEGEFNYSTNDLDVNSIQSLSENLTGGDKISITPIASNEVVDLSIDMNKDNSSDFNLFEQRQLQYFIGKMVEKEIKLDNGDVLNVGEIITSDVITKIKTRSTLMEVTSHLRKQ